CLTMVGSKSDRAFTVVTMAPSPHLAAISVRCSTIGPRANAGTKVSAPTRSTTPISRPTKSGVWVGSVPGPLGTIFLRASAPAMARVEHALLQHRAGLRHAVRGLLAGDSDAAHRWTASR